MPRVLQLSRIFFFIPWPWLCMLCVLGNIRAYKSQELPRMVLKHCWLKWKGCCPLPIASKWDDNWKSLLREPNTVDGQAGRCLSFCTDLFCTHVLTWWMWQRLGLWSWGIGDTNCSEGLEACLCACIWRKESMSAVGKSNSWEVRIYQEKPEGKAEDG